MRTIKIKYKKEETLGLDTRTIKYKKIKYKKIKYKKINMMTRTKGIEKETKKQWDKHKEEDTKETKIK